MKGWRRNVIFFKNSNESWLCFVRDWAGIQWFAQFSVYFPAAASYPWSLIAWLICLAGVSVWDRCNLNIHGWLLRNTNQGLKGCKLVFLLNSQMILSNLFVWITQLHLSPAARIKTKSAGSSSIRAWLFHDESFCREFRKVQFISSYNFLLRQPSKSWAPI